MSGFTRRSLMGRCLASAGALTLPGSLVAAETANAQADDQTEALERLIVGEQAAELAYSLAAEEGDLDAQASMLFEELSLHSEDRGDALSEAMDQLLVDPPDKSSDPDEYDSLDDFVPAGSQADLLAFMTEQELELISAYEEEVPELDEPDLARTAAQAAASHAQALVALRLLAKETGSVTELPAPSTSATDSVEEDSDS